MTATVEQARDQMLSLIKAVWPSGETLVYDGFKEEKPTAQEVWGRVSVRHNSGGQCTISKIGGKSRYERTGTLYINLFAPPGDGLRALDPLTKTVLDAIEGKTTSGGVWFTKTRVREMGIVEGWYQVNVLANFSYEELK